MLASRGASGLAPALRALPGLQTLDQPSLGLAAGLGSEARRWESSIVTPAVTNTGLRAGPGGRSSVSGITATVFGCTGFLGRYIVNALANQGSQVIVPYRCDDVDMQHLRVMGDLGQIVTWRGFDIRNDDHIRTTIARSNVVINLLGIDKETANFSFEDVHVDAAARIAKSAADNDVTERLWQVSCLNASESAPSRRLQTKAAGEKAVRDAFPKATIFKPGVMVGVEDRLFNTFAQTAKRFPFVPLINGGSNRLQPVWVRDVSGAIVSTLNSRQSLGETYHLAGPEVFTLEELVRLVYETIREPYRVVSVPHSIAKATAAPREWLLKRLPITLPYSTMLTADYFDEQQADSLLPPDALTFADLDVPAPRKISAGLPIEHLRYFRVGGYDVGTTSQRASTGGAGFSG